MDEAALMAEIARAEAGVKSLQAELAATTPPTAAASSADAASSSTPAAKKRKRNLTVHTAGRADGNGAAVSASSALSALSADYDQFHHVSADSLHSEAELEAEIARAEKSFRSLVRRLEGDGLTRDEMRRTLRAQNLPLDFLESISSSSRSKKRKHRVTLEELRTLRDVSTMNEAEISAEMEWLREELDEEMSAAVAQLNEQQLQEEIRKVEMEIERVCQDASRAVAIQ
jgi:chromosome segregation ATPase